MQLESDKIPSRRKRSLRRMSTNTVGWICGHPYGLASKATLQRSCSFTYRLSPPLCFFVSLCEISWHRMKTSLLVVGVLNLLILGVRAQIPHTWTRNELAKIYGGPVTIGYAHARIKTVTFIKPAPASFHPAECFALIVMVLRGPGVPMLRPDSGNIKFFDNGNTTVWTDRLSGYSIDGDRAHMQFTARSHGVVRLTAKVIKARDGSDLILTEA
jgi:hypothetical protein